MAARQAQSKLRTLFLLRHGIAVERDPTERGRDSQRPLTAEGEQKVRAIAKELRRRKIEFDVILSSPFVRALRTAEIVAEVFDAGGHLEVCDALAVGGDPASLVRRLQRRHAKAAAVLLVGHEPYLSELASVLLTGDRQMSLTLKKGGVCKLSATRFRFGRCATLEWLLTPRMLLGS